MKLARMGWPRNTLTVGEMRKTYTVLFGKHKGMGPLRRLRLRMKDNIETDLEEIWCEVLERPQYERYGHDNNPKSYI